MLHTSTPGCLETSMLISPNLGQQGNQVQAYRDTATNAVNQQKTTTVIADELVDTAVWPQNITLDARYRTRFNSRCSQVQVRHMDTETSDTWTLDSEHATAASIQQKTLKSAVQRRMTLTKLGKYKMENERCRVMRMGKD